MREYDTGTWGVAFAFSLRGSVIPKSVAWAVPATLLAVGFNLASRYDEGFRAALDEGLGTQLKASQVFVAYNFLLTFILSFRSSQAYARWWEGGTLLLQARGEWFNAYSSLIAFRTTNPDKWKETKSFEKILATMMSMLFCSALNSVAQSDLDFEVRSHVDLSDDSLALLRDCPDKCEVIVHWIQRLIVLNMEAGTLPIPPPVMSRVFHELSRGMVKINDARKISDFLLPFPYAQLSSCMLLVNVVLTPAVLGVLFQEWYSAAICAFVSIFAFAAVNCIASEIECPFGSDENDLPMQAMQKLFNDSITELLDTRAQHVPVDQGAIIEAFATDMDGATGANHGMQRVMGKQPGKRYYVKEPNASSERPLALGRMATRLWMSATWSEGPDPTSPTAAGCKPPSTTSEKPSGKSFGSAEVSADEGQVSPRSLNSGSCSPRAAAAGVMRGSKRFTTTPADGAVLADFHDFDTMEDLDTPPACRTPRSPGGHAMGAALLVGPREGMHKQKSHGTPRNSMRKQSFGDEPCVDPLEEVSVTSPVLRHLPPPKLNAKHVATPPPPRKPVEMRRARTAGDAGSPAWVCEAGHSRVPESIAEAPTAGADSMTMESTPSVTDAVPESIDTGIISAEQAATVASGPPLSRHVMLFAGRASC